MAQIQTDRIPEYLKEKVVDAQAALKNIEDEAQKFLKDIMEKGKASRRELDELLTRVSTGEFMEKVKANEQASRAKVAQLANRVRTSEFASKAQGLQKELLGRLDELQHKVLEVVGVATRDQVSVLSREISKLSKRVEKIAKRSKRNHDA